MRKAHVLQFVHQRNTCVTNAEVAGAFKVPESHVGSILCKLARQGLVSRAWRSLDGRRVSWVSPRGVERLQYWQKRDQNLAAPEEEEQEDAGFVKLFPEQLDEGGEASQNDAPDETPAEPDGLAKYFPRR